MARALPLLLVLAIAAPARAQDAEPDPSYGPLVEAALAEFNARRWAEARSLFERAHEVFPNARTLRGLGMAAFEMRDYVAAVRALEGALASSVRPLTDEQRAQVDALLVRARLFLGRFRVGPAPPGSTIAVDGVRTQAEGDLADRATVVLAVGAHEVELRAPDGRTARAQVTVRGGEDVDLEVSIAPPHDDALVLEPPDPPMTEAPIEVRDGASTGPDPAPWLIVGAGGVVAIAGAILLPLGIAEGDRVRGATVGTEWADLEDSYARAEPLAISGGVALGVGAALLGIGLAWGIVDLGRAPARVSIWPGGVRGTF